jgi:transposase
MEQLHQWLEAQFAFHRVEPNLGLGKAITYLLRHWKALTAFLREASAPLDNNVCERALKRAILHRKNALCYRTLHGSQVGDLFMSPIHTCELADAQRHASELAANPSAWMPWNYRP